MTLSLTWTQRLKGVPTDMRGCIKDFFDNVLPGLTNWSPHGTAVKLGSTPGEQGGAGVRDSDGAEFCLFDFVSGDPTGGGATGPPGGDTISMCVGSLSTGSNQTSGIFCAGFNIGAAYFDLASKFLGANGTTAIFFSTSSRTGFFVRGETLNVDGGTYAAPILEVFHDGSLGGCIFIGNWTTGTPTTSQLSSLTLTGVTSGATATILTTSADRYPSFCWYRMGESNAYFLRSVTGSAPTGTITGSTSGLTGTFSTYTPTSQNRLVVTGANGRFLHNETITWSGGSAVVEHVPPNTELIGVGPSNSATVPIATEADASGYLIAEDADRLLLLFPNNSGGPTQYRIFAFGKWAESVRGGGAMDCVINASSSLFPINNVSFCMGLAIDSVDGFGLTMSDISNNPGSDANMGGGVVPCQAALPSSTLTAGSQQRVSYDYAQDQGSTFLLGGTMSKRPDRFLFRRNFPSGGKDRPEYTLYGFFTGPTPTAINQLLTNSDSSRYGLQISDNAAGLFIDFDDASITP